MKVRQDLIEHIKSEGFHELQNLDIEIQALLYLAHLSEFLIQKFKSDNVYHEKIVENSGFCSHDFYGPRFSLKVNIVQHQLPDNKHNDNLEFELLGTKGGTKHRTFEDL